MKQRTLISYAVVKPGTSIVGIHKNGPKRANMIIRELVSQSFSCHRQRFYMYRLGTGKNPEEWVGAP
jgi:hypothetical protein